MLYSSHLILFLLALFQLPQLNAAALSENLESVLKSSRLAGESVSLVVTEEINGVDQVVFTKNAETPRQPASLTKLLTAAAIFEQGARDWSLKTAFYASQSEIKSGVLKGPLYLKGGGDPTFVSEDLWYLVNQLSVLGIRKIDGSLVIDDSIHDGDIFTAGRLKNRVDRAYDAPVSGMTFNWNTMNVYIQTHDGLEKPHVVVDPDCGYAAIKNTSKFGTKNTIQFERTVVGGKDVVRVSGEIKKGAQMKPSLKPVTQPNEWVACQVRHFLNQQGISIEAKWKNSKTPEDAKELARTREKSITEVVLAMQKYSNNLIAEMMTKNMGHFSVGQGNMVAGLSAMRTTIESLGVKKENVELTSPSGLARENKLRAIDLIDLLNRMKRDLRYGPEYVASLPIGGVDGTLSKRLNGPKVKGWIRAKTGYINGVVGLAGYASSNSTKKARTFVFIYNGEGKESLAKEIFDSLAARLVEVN